MSISNPSGQPNPWQPQPMTPLERDITHLRSLVRWLVVLVVVNLALTAYVADFVHTILQDIHSI